MKKKAALNLRELRTAKGWTQQETADRAGVNYSTFQAIESGRGGGYSAVTKHKIADALGVNFFELFPEVRATVEALVGRHTVNEMLARNGKKE